MKFRDTTYLNEIIVIEKQLNSRFLKDFNNFIIFYAIVKKITIIYLILRLNIFGLINKYEN